MVLTSTATEHLVSQCSTELGVGGGGVSVSGQEDPKGGGKELGASC